MINATPGASTANSYLTVAELDAYLLTRIGSATTLTLPIGVKEGLLTMATRTLDMMFMPHHHFNAETGYVEVYPTWTGAPTNPAVQALAWPRTGMYNRNGYPIPSDVIPIELKDATSEMAFYLSKEDTTADSEVAVKGISNIKAGSVSISYRDDVAVTKIIPDSVMFMLVPSWLTDLEVEYPNEAEFDVI